MPVHKCDSCGTTFEGPYDKMKYCNSCADDKAMENLAQVEPPEGGWPKNSDMDRL